MHKLTSTEQQNPNSQAAKHDPLDRYRGEGLVIKLFRQPESKQDRILVPIKKRSNLVTRMQNRIQSIAAVRSQDSMHIGGLDEQPAQHNSVIDC